jgi:lipopolysaccharide export system protein LptC
VHRRNISVGLLLLIIAAGSWWLARQLESDGRSRQADQHLPDYTLEQLATTTLDKEGKPLRRLQASRLAHYPDDDSTELSRPHLTLYEEGRPPWRVRSERGWLSGDGELLLLQGQVDIDRSAAPTVRPAHIVTHNLRVQPRENYAETDEQVSMRSEKSWVTSKGLQLWFAQPMRLKLLTNVRGHYEVN